MVLGWRKKENDGPVRSSSANILLTRFFNYREFTRPFSYMSLHKPHMLRGIRPYHRSVYNLWRTQHRFLHILYMYACGAEC